MGGKQGFTGGTGMEGFSWSNDHRGEQADGEYIDPQQRIRSWLESVEALPPLEGALTYEEAAQRVKGQSIAEGTFDTSTMTAIDGHFEE